MASAIKHGQNSHGLSRNGQPPFGQPQFGQTLQVSICEIERGVFYATYRQAGLALHMDDLPTYQLGKSAAAARQQIQLSAQALGFVSFNWTQTSSAPLFPVLSEPTQAKVAVADTATRRFSNAAGE